MRRLIVLATVLLSLVAGCARDSRVARISAVDAGIDAVALEEYLLCGHAIDAVRVIIKELLAAPNTSAALIQQTVTSYTKYAAKLRELAELVTSAERKALILDAAHQADRYADEVRIRNNYHVDIQPVMEASYDAFPRCDLGH